jgi:hypothetical protein
VAFKGQDPIRNKTAGSNVTLAQVNRFTCLGCRTAGEKVMEVTLRVRKFIQTLGILNNV